MKQFIHRIVKSGLVLLLLLVFVSSGMGQIATYKEGVRQGVVRVKFKPEFTASLKTMKVSTANAELTTGIEALDAVADKYAASNMRRIFPEHPNPKIEAKHQKHGLHLWYEIKLEVKSNLSEAVQDFKTLETIALAEVEYEKTLGKYEVRKATTSKTNAATSTVDDPRFEDQWHYQNTGQVGAYEQLADINLLKAWETNSGSNDVVVAVIDQGVDSRHNDLADNMWINTAELNGEDGVDDDGNGYVDDIHGYNFDTNSGAINAQNHGTHVAGTVSAVNNNGVGVAGVAGGTGNSDGVRIMSLQALGGGAVENTFIYAADNGAVISQNSWGFVTPGVYNQSILDAIDYFIEEAGDYPGSPMKGGLVLFAAGNDNLDDRFYPGVYENVVAVGSTGPDKKKASYSNYGAWVDITAPGGETNYGSTSGVLSTLPSNAYGYLDGTSMACPHVSGVAALILSNRDHQFTAEELKHHLLTSVSELDSYNPEYAGKLGTGHLDAAMAMFRNLGQAPNRILDLSIALVSQDFVALQWNVPADADDETPFGFHIYHSTEEITALNIENAEHQFIRNTQEANTAFSFEVDGLDGLTEYHFAVISEDRWGNQAQLSNVVMAETNAGPAISVDANSEEIDIVIDAATNTSGTHDITILNTDEGYLKWEYIARQKSYAPFSTSALHYPQPSKTKPAKAQTNIIQKELGVFNAKILSDNNSIAAFEPSEIVYTEYYSLIAIGETDLELPNSSATLYHVADENGFNLTDIEMILQHDVTTGPIIVEVYEGQSLEAENLIYAQEYSVEEEGIHWALISFEEQMFFPQGSSFSIVLHVPSNNQFPLGMGPERSEEYSDYCKYSSDMGKTWQSLEEAIDNPYFVWTTIAMSRNKHLGEFMSLNPATGEVEGYKQMSTTLTVDASTLINGEIKSNLILKSNDSNKRELRIPVNVTITGYEPNLQSQSLANFGGVFIGTSFSGQVLLENIGQGSMNNITAISNHPDFEVVEVPEQIEARDDAFIVLKYTPTTEGGVSSQIILTSDEGVFELAVYGTGIVAPQISVTPQEQTIENIVLGDEVVAQYTVSNGGEFPLKYYIPGFDDAGVSEEIEGDFHQYGYKYSSNEPGAENPVDYVWQDIQGTGVKITDFFMAEDFSGDGSEFHYPVPLNFSMPFYSHSFDTLYITKQGMVDFENKRRLVNLPYFEFEWGPEGFITALGEHFEFSVGGDVYYLSTDDKIIVQYEKAQMSWYEGRYFTFQIVLHDNGNINIYYKDIMQMFEAYPLMERAPLVGIEDPEGLDPVQASGYSSSKGLIGPLQWFNGLALEFTYPGPDIISSVQNGSGVVLPGESKLVELTFATENLYEGTITRSVNFIANDPINGSTVATTTLEITSGGAAEIVVDQTSLDFGQLYQGDVKGLELIVSNKGTAAESVVLALVQDHFIIEGNVNPAIAPLRREVYEIQIPTDVVGVFEDELTITTTESGSFTVSLTGEIVDPPGIEVDLNPISLILTHGEQFEMPLSVASTGIADLEFSVHGTEWLSPNFDNSASNPTKLSKYGYTYANSKDGGTDFAYSWKNILETGTRLPVEEMSPFDPEKNWKAIELPFAFEFYGESYTTAYLSYNGMISFSADQPPAPYADHLPIEDGPVNFIAALWLSGGFDTITYGEKSGLYYETFDDYAVITYSYIINLFGMGSMISTQTILYKTGEIKFQYRIEENYEEMSTMRGTVGLVNQDGSDYLQISALKSLGLQQDGMAIVVSPNNSTVIPAGETAEGTITFDATNLYAGTYESNIVYTSTVPGSESLMRPITLKVFGETTLTLSEETIDFGDKMVYSYEELPVVYEQLFSIQNTGASPVKVNDLVWENEEESLVAEVYVYLDGLWSWQPTSVLTGLESLQPEESLQGRILFTPDAANTGAFENKLTISSSLTGIAFTVQGNVLLPPVVGTDLEEVEVHADSPSHVESKTIQLHNQEGAMPLDYTLFIEMQRDDIASSSIAPSNTGTGDLSELSTIDNYAISTSSTATVTEEFNRTLSYESAEVPATFLGYNGSGELRAATHFVAESNGFNLTHIQTYFRLEGETSATINLQVLAGSAGVAAASTIASFEYTATGDGEDEEGSWHTIELPESVTLAPGEEFYVVATYPATINYPAGVLTDLGDHPGRYALESQGEWYDLQVDAERPGEGWMMRAAEKEFASGQWITLKSTETGTLGVGESTMVEVEFDALNASQKWQKANLVVYSNDPETPQHRVALSMYLNAGPEISAIPDNLYVYEGDTLYFTAEVADPEDHAFTVSLAHSNPGVSYSYEAGMLNVRYVPGYDAAENTTIFIDAEDALGAATTMEMEVKVFNVNRAPIGTGITSLFYVENGALDARSFNEFIKDPDNDKLSYTIKSSNSEVIEVFHSEEEFVLQPGQLGTAIVTMTATDIYGASAEINIAIEVATVLATEEEQSGFKAYPNPVSDALNFYWDNSWNGEVAVEVLDLSGKAHFARVFEGVHQGTTLQIDCSNLNNGIYLLRVTNEEKTSVVKIIKE